MQHTNMNEKSLEDLIVNHLVKVNGYELGQSDDYDRDYALDVNRLEAFLRNTQNDLVRSSRIFDTPVNRRKFLERVRKEITERGVVDVLRKGVKHLSNTFYFYSPYPSELSSTGKKLYALNKFAVIRQLHYSQANTKLSVDVVLFINGLPKQLQMLCVSIEQSEIQKTCCSCISVVLCILQLTMWMFRCAQSCAARRAGSFPSIWVIMMAQETL